MAEQKKKVRILSIDGGGIRGILPGVILAKLESILQQKTGDSDLRLSDKLDFIAGTSTGGILACTYLMPDENGKPKFTAQEAVNLYLDRGDEIFDLTFKQKIKSGFGISDEKYSANELEEALMDNFGETNLNELLKPCVITSYDIRNRNAFFFRQHRAENLDNNFKVRDVARATSAAPTYFEVSRVKNLKGTPFPLIDGGVFANNPTLCAYSETRTLTNFKINKPTAKDMLIISIGTGGKKTSYAYKEAKDWGKLKWIQPVIDIMMSGNSETVHHHLKQIFDTLKPADKKDYYRLEPEVITASYEMDDASIENLRNLESDALNYIAKKNVAKQLNEIADKLLKY